MKFHVSMGRLVRFSRGGKASFHINVLNNAPFEIEAKEGIEEVSKQLPRQSLSKHRVMEIPVQYINQHMNTYSIHRKFQCSQMFVLFMSECAFKKLKTNKAHRQCLRACAQVLCEQKGWDRGRWVRSPTGCCAHGSCQAWLQKQHGWHHVGQFSPWLHEQAQETLLLPFRRFISGREGILGSERVFANREW